MGVISASASNPVRINPLNRTLFVTALCAINLGFSRLKEDEKALLEKGLLQMCVAKSPFVQHEHVHVH
jgi:hypothetical protein